MSKVYMNPHGVAARSRRLQNLSKDQARAVVRLWRKKRMDSVPRQQSS